jgi:hypothetical protein
LSRNNATFGIDFPVLGSKVKNAILISVSATRVGVMVDFYI